MFSARITLAIFSLLAIAGIALGWNKGRLPHPQLAVAEAEGTEPTGVDLQLYREVVAEVRTGRDYYEVAREKLPQFGFPISSPFNWRLPTYAWLFALAPNECCVQGALLLLAAGALWLAFASERRRSGLWPAALVTFLLFGVVRWTFDGEAYLAQEVWAAVLLVISIAAHARSRGREPYAVNPSSTGKAGRPQKAPDSFRFAWPIISILAGTAALLFRELALPYCVLAYALAIWNRRWLEAVGWGAGIGAFGLLMGWHIGQVQGQLAGVTGGASAGLVQWLRWGGLDFVLLTTRMNSLLFSAFAPLLWLYLLAALVGLARRSDETSRLCCLGALAYLLAFAIVGRPENFYWGLLPAPFLAWGVAQFPAAFTDLWRQAWVNAKTKSVTTTRA